MNRIVIALALLATSVAAPRAGAQSPYLVSVEANLGAGVGRGGEYEDRAGVALDALATIPLRAQWQGTLVAGLGVSALFPVGGTDDCVIGTGGRCIPTFPMMLPVAALIGWEPPGGVVRALAGPAFVYLEQGGRADRTSGLMGRVDVASPSVLRVSAIVSLRGLVLPSYRGDLLRVGSLGVGLRVR